MFKAFTARRGYFCMDFVRVTFEKGRFKDEGDFVFLNTISAIRPLVCKDDLLMYMSG